MAEELHTALPWYTTPSAGHEIHNQHIIASESDGNTVAIVYNGANDATLICRAVNNHDALIETIERLLSYEDDAPPADSFGAEVYAKARATLTAARAN